MKEEFLHYLWRFKKFDTSNLETSNKEQITIVHSGQYLQLAGPDFFNAQIIIGNQKWAGNVEIHLKSSDWYVHHHERDEAYGNVILHVVWEHDAEIFGKDNAEIPVLEMKHYVSKDALDNYQSLKAPKSWIFCEKQLKEISDFTFENWKAHLFLERLERKSLPIQDLFETLNKDWEAVLFCLLAKNFGLNTNGESFFKIATSIPFQIIRKESEEVENIEALLFGRSGLLDVEKEDIYFQDLKFRYFYLLHKYQIEKAAIAPLQFFKHRPDNFPTIRLSQFANLYFNQHNLFSKLMTVKNAKEVYGILDVAVSAYWQNHYQFDKESPKKKKQLSRSFIDLIIINTLLPIQFTYYKNQNKEIYEDIIELSYEVAPERNAIIEKFFSFGIKSENAFSTQALLQLKNEYCNKGKCLECAIGTELLKY